MNDKTKVVSKTQDNGHWKFLFADKTALLGSYNLNKGEELIGTIKNTTIEEIKNKKGDPETVAMLNFENVSPMVLNKTNSATIAALYGENRFEWTGKKIQLFATLVRSFGSTTMGLRVRPFIPREAIDLAPYRKKMDSCENSDQLKKAWTSFNSEVRTGLEEYKNELKSDPRFQEKNNNKEIK